MIQKFYGQFFFTVYFLLVTVTASAQVIDTTGKIIYGNGLESKSFLYVGEWDTRRPDSQMMSIVRNGKLVWQYSIPLHPQPNANQEFDDITMMNDGNIMFARMSGAGIVTPAKKLIWNFVCPPGSETHSCQPIGKDSALLVLNANPAKVLIINTATNQILKEILIPVVSTNTHGQFRHARLTPTGTIVLGLMGENKVVEYSLEGKEIWSAPAKAVWSAVRLKNGNTLISGDWMGYTREIEPSGKTVWEITQADVPFKLYNTQTANRLENGNTIICNWVAGNKKTEQWASSVQAFEVTPDKKIVWVLSSWNKPDLGPCTSIQTLNKKGLPDKNDVQR